MTTAIAELAELRLFTPEQAAKIMSGDLPGSVSGYWLREQIRDGRFPYTPMGRRRMLSRADIAEIIAICRVAPKSRPPRRKSA